MEGGDSSIGQTSDRVNSTIYSTASLYCSCSKMGGKLAVRGELRNDKCSAVSPTPEDEREKGNHQRHGVMVVTYLD